MFGSFIGSAGSAQTDFGEQMLNTVASQSIRRMFSQCDAVEVNIRCFPSSKLLQGSLDSVKMHGSGLLIRRQFRVEEMSFETDAIAIDFGSVLRGQIKLKQPTQAIAQVTLSEDGINEAFNAELVQKRLDQVTLAPNDELGIDSPVSFRDISVKLLPANQVQIQAKVDVPDRGLIPLAVQTTLAVERRRRLLFNDPRFQPDLVPEEHLKLSEALTASFVEILNGMIDLDRFDLDGVEMRINRVETRQEKLLFSGYAQINRFPGVKG
jgi:LmeA-like phospholipid-binding